MTLGATRTTWMSLHVWSSIAMFLLTIGHVVLNRKGVTRSLRVVSGRSNKAASDRSTKRGFAWVGAALLIAVTTFGGYWFASVDDTHGNTGREVAAGGSIQMGGGNGSSSHGHGRG
jgi:hypothetical protein